MKPLAVLVLYVTREDTLHGIRGDCQECPVARALRRWLPFGVWQFDGDCATNDYYGVYWLRVRVGDDGGVSDIKAYDAGEPLRRRRFVFAPTMSAAT